MTTKKPARREFIPAIREGIAANCPVAPQAVEDAIDSWRDGNEPAHPLEAGIFAMCDKVAADLDAFEPDEGGDS